MTREEFHLAYSEMPEDFKAELVGGIVYVASPASERHATDGNLFNTALGLYRARTPGVQAFDNGTFFLDEDSEPQPDVALRILPEYGGQTRPSSDGRFVVGAPELVIEVAYSSKSIDLHGKRRDYARCGVKEYVVWIGTAGTFVWFDLTQNVPRPVPPENVIKSFVFPGLWIDGAAVWADDAAKLVATLEAGLATPEHAAFVKRLADAKK